MASSPLLDAALDYHAPTKLGQLEHPATTVMLTENGPAPVWAVASIAAGWVPDWWVAGDELPVDTTVTPHVSSGRHWCRCGGLAHRPGECRVCRRSCESRETR